MREIFLVLALSLMAISVFGQASGSVSGTIKDSAGAAIPGAEVKLVNSQQVTIKVVQTDSQGRYRFESVSDGTYVVQASRPNFSVRNKAVKVDRGVSSETDVELTVNQLTEQVTVTADTGQVEEKDKIPQQINIIAADGISQRTTNVLAQIADEESGISLQRTSPTIGAVLVRGMTEVGVYVDGVRYTNSTQRGGINTFFNLNEPTALQSAEVQRSPNTAQFGSDGLGGNVQLVSRQPGVGFVPSKWHGEFNSNFGSADLSFGGNALVTYSGKRYGVMTNVVGRRVNTLRPGGGIESHSAITRFLGLPSDIIGTERLPDTAFTQYGGTFHANFAPRADQNFSFRYQRSQQDGGKRYDQLLGGDGNLIADLRNLMLDFGYVRYFKQGFGFFDHFSANVSLNSQREERINQGGQGNPTAAITNDRERTSTYGVSFYMDKQFAGNSFLVGGDYYHDKVNAPSFSTDPVTRAVTIVRPRVPNGSTYKLAGVYVQNVLEAVKERLRFSGSLRYNVASYRSRSAEAPVVGGSPLFPDDSARFADLSGRIGMTATILTGLNFAVNYSRGFRAPNITSLGGLGLVGVGFQVSTADVAGLGATIGTTADATAVSSGIPVGPLRSEISDNVDVSIRFRNSRFEFDLTGFTVDYGDTIVRQTLILPQGAVGRQLGSQTITSQNANGAVFVPASTSPILVQSNFSNTRMNGAEFNMAYRFADSWTIAGNYSYLFATDRATNLPPNLGGGGVPPQFGFLRLRYQPTGKRYWIEAYANAAGRQDRLSSLDIGDRRTGGARTRSQIQNFIRRGACVRGITAPTVAQACGTANGNYQLLATGETLAQVLNRVLPIGSVINGVLVANNDTAVPLFAAIPGYGLINIRGGYRFSERHEVNFDLENMADKGHRAPGWGIDGPGRNLTVRYRLKF
jgi:hemoglobin/transferrin/lactoferrin receptor protein